MQRLLVTLLQYGVCSIMPWLVSGMSVGSKVLLSAAAISSLSVALFYAGWWGRRRVKRITWQQSGDWVLTRASPSETTPWILQASSFATPLLMILRWRCVEDSAAVLVFYGEMTTSEWRRWQARLRLHGLPDASTKGHLQ